MVSGKYHGWITLLYDDVSVSSLSSLLSDISISFLHQLFLYSRAVTSLAFSMDGVSLVSGSEDCTARLWDTASRQVLRTFTHNKGMFLQHRVWT